MEDQDTFLQLPEKRKISIRRAFIMISLPPCWCPKTTKEIGLWSKPVLMGVELFSYANISFVTSNLHSYWPGQMSENALYFVEQVPISDLKTYHHSAFLIYNYQYTKKI